MQPLKGTSSTPVLRGSFVSSFQVMMRPWSVLGFPLMAQHARQLEPGAQGNIALVGIHQLLNGSVFSIRQKDFSLDGTYSGSWVRQL